MDRISDLAEKLGQSALEIYVVVCHEDVEDPVRRRPVDRRRQVPYRLEETATGFLVEEVTETYRSQAVARRRNGGFPSVGRGALPA
ncbi:MAG TPA: hypothetical protein VGS22_01810 [Thermoanaerobaculia bacterium]|nr:hypothetical protein [Thermoanaerobaculia bacterium]